MKEKGTLDFGRYRGKMREESRRMRGLCRADGYGDGDVDNERRGRKSQGIWLWRMQSLHRFLLGGSAA